MATGKKTKTSSRHSKNGLVSGQMLARLKKANFFLAGIVVAIVGVAGSYWAYQSFAATPEIASGRPGYCLDDHGDGVLNGNPVDIWTCNGSAAQHWVADGYYMKINGKCLDAKGWGTANGTPIELYTCNGGANQQWTFTNGSLKNVHAQKCLDDTGWGNNGTQLELYTCTGKANQAWYVSSYAVSNGGGSCGSGYHASDYCSQQYAWSKYGDYGWNLQWTSHVNGGPASPSGTFTWQTCLKYLWNHESGWQWNADNPSSGAYGIPQSLPGSKMSVEGSNWGSNAFTQVRWGMDYIKRNSKAANYDRLPNGSYVTNPCQALEYENIHNSY